MSIYCNFCASFVYFSYFACTACIAGRLEGTPARRGSAFQTVGVLGVIFVWVCSFARRWCLLVGILFLRFYLVLCGGAGHEENFRNTTLNQQQTETNIEQEASTVNKNKKSSNTTSSSNNNKHNGNNNNDDGDDH